MGPRVEIPALTGLRFLAALCVALTHLTIVAGITVFGYRLDTAPLGMSLFFCLSGFIIHYIYGEFFAAGPRQTIGRFYAARFSRLYPLYLAFLLFIVLYTPPFRDVLRHGILLIPYTTLTATWWYWTYDGKAIEQLPGGLSWSISTEWFFYLAYALLLYRVMRLRNAAAVAGILAGLLVTYLAVVYVVSEWWWDIEPTLLAWSAHPIPARVDYDDSMLRWLLYVSPYIRIFDFLGGCLAAQIYFLLRSRKQHGLHEVIFWSGIAWIVLALGFFIYSNSESGRWVFTTVPHAGFLSATHQNWLFTPGALLVILGAALGCSGTRLLALGPLILLGEVSYSIYLSHPLAMRIAPVSITDQFPFTEFAVTLVIVCVLAIGLYAVIEAPAKRWLRRALAFKPLAAISAARGAVLEPALAPLFRHVVSMRRISGRKK